ncbi:hypothetical protein [Dactylosporangium roseum]|uniref:hypothetical protein n=1 Tax=Dactylosporangium roseum TaxID=47989 RepID=UPI0021B3E970|nr:hypothetical protein [Dactylosporangium roseum]
MKIGTGGSGHIGGPGRIGPPVAGDDAGDLDDSRRQRPDTPVYGTNRDADGVRAGLAAATR